MPPFASRRRQATPPPHDLGQLFHERMAQSVEQSKSFEDRCLAYTILDKRKKLIPFRWNETQKIYWQLRERAKKVLLLKYRQGGFTTFEMADTYDRFKRAPGSQSLFIADTEKKAAIIFRIAMRFYEHDPNRPRMKRPPGLACWEGANGAFIDIETAGARGAGGRGATPSAAKCTEVSRWPGTFDSIEDKVLGLLEGAQNGVVVMETTPNGEDAWFYPTWQEPSDWLRVFLVWHLDPQYQMDWNQQNEWLSRLAPEARARFEERIGPIGSEDAILDTLKDDERGLLSKVNLTLFQLAWRRVNVFTKRKLFLQEFPEDPATAFIVSGSTLFDLADIHAAIQSAPAPVQVLKAENAYHIEKFILAPAKGRRYFIGADVAQGLTAGDRSAYSVRDDTGFQAEAGWIRESPEAFAQRLDKLGRFYGTALLAPEANGLGQSTLNELMNHWRYPHVWKTLSWNGQRWAQAGGHGWLTTSSTRPLLFSDFLEDFMVNCSLKVNSHEQLTEMKGIVLNKGRYEGNHDDLFMADAICNQMLRLSTVPFIQRLGDHRPPTPLLSV